MDKQEIYQILQDDYNANHPSELSEIDRWRLYENLKANIRVNGNPENYTRELITISDALEL